MVKKYIFEVDNVSIQDIQKIDNFVEKIRLSNSIKAHKNDKTGMVRLKKFRDNLTEKQNVIFDYFMKNPGPVYGNYLREALPTDWTRGALPGVFKIAKRWEPLGGEKMECPFFKIEFDQEQQCAKYRGLTLEEIKYLLIE